MELYFPHLLLTFGVLFVSYAIGQLLLRRAAEGMESNFEVFMSTMVGLIFLVGTYAAICTWGRTVLLPIPFLMGCLVLKQSKAGADFPKLRPSTLLFMSAMALVIFTFRFWLFSDSTSQFLATPFQDFVFYARVSIALNQTGVESMTLESVFPQFIHAQPYHYFELWLNALLVRVTGLSAVWSLCLSTYTVLLVMVGLGIRALVAHFGLKNRWALLLTVVLLLCDGVKWPVFMNYSFTRNGILLAGSQLLTEPKLASIAMFMALSALLIVRRSYVQSGIVLACIPLIYVSTGPAIGVSAGVLGLYLLISRRCTLVQVAQFMLPLLLTIGYFVVFYATRSSPPEIMEPGGKLADELVPDFGEAHTLLNLFIGTLTLYGLFLGFPLLACAVVFSRKAWQQKRDTLLPLLVWAGTCILMAAVGSTLASHFVDGFQFSGNVIGALLPTLLAVLVGAAFLKTTVWRRVAAITLLAIGAFVNYSALFSQHKLEMLGSTTYSAQFLREVQKALPDNEVRGGFLFDDKDYESAYMLSEDTYSAGTYLAGMTNHYDLMSLSIFSVDSLNTDPRYRRDSVQARERLHNASIYRYARLEAPASHLSIDSLQYKFVKRYNLAFICASAKAVLPDMLRPLVAKEIVDPRSGEKFYVLNK